MNKQFLGTDYGGWVLDVDSVNDGDTIISGGIGTDISFDREISKLKNVTIIMVDPTEKSHNYLAGTDITRPRLKKNMKLIKKAIEAEGTKSLRLYKNTNPNHVSESLDPTHPSVGGEYHDVECISVSELIRKYKPSVLKLDIEGSEYNVIKECIGPKQVCIEFHHRCIDSIDLTATLECVNFMETNGYEIIDCRNGHQEITFRKHD